MYSKRDNAAVGCVLVFILYTVYFLVVGAVLNVLTDILVPANQLDFGQFCIAGVVLTVLIGLIK